MNTISVIIPTTGTAERASPLMRTIQSALKQEGVKVEVVVVLIGTQFTEWVLEALGDMPITQVHGFFDFAPIGRRAGLKAATGEYFCFLADHEQLEPGALASRLAWKHSLKRREHAGFLDWAWPLFSTVQPSNRG